MKQNTARFDARLSAEQKSMFEKAAVLGGYRNLTDFVIAAVRDKANEIIEKNESIIASERDKEIFFSALMNPPKPNNELFAAKEELDNLVAE